MTAATRYLLDTNVVSELVKPRAVRNPGVAARVTEEADGLVTCAPVWHELEYGCRRLAPGRKRKAIESALARLQASLVILPYDARAARWHAAERARLVANGRTPPFVDGQIAAVAVVHDLVVVTRNGADYAGFDSLRVESWHA